MFFMEKSPRVCAPPPAGEIYAVPAAPGGGEWGPPRTERRKRLIGLPERPSRKANGGNHCWQKQGMLRKSGWLCLWKRECSRGCVKTNWYRPALKVGCHRRWPHCRWNGYPCHLGSEYNLVAFCKRETGGPFLSPRSAFPRRLWSERPQRETP